MKRIFIAKLLGLLTAFLLLFNLLISNFSLSVKEFQAEKEKTSQKTSQLSNLDDNNLIEFVNEANEESIEEADSENLEKSIADFSFFDFNTYVYKVKIENNVKLKPNNLLQVREESVPLWLLVRQILI